MQSLRILTIENNNISVSHKFAHSTSLLQTTDLIFLVDLEKFDENKAEFENSDNLKKRSC